MKNNSLIYERPYSRQVIELLSKIPNVRHVIWSSAEKSYIRDILHSIKFPKIFCKRIFSRKDCDSSVEMYGIEKHGDVIRRYFKSKQIILMGIDDLADHNMKSGYDYTLKISEFKCKDQDFAFVDEVMPFIVKILN